MSNNIEKSFEERLHSLKVGCIIFGVLELLALISSVYSLSSGTGNSTIFSLLIQVAMLAVIYFMYKFTSEKNSLGPVLEYVFGALLLAEGILYCITIVGILFGVIAIVLAVGVLKEATYFKNYIAEDGSNINGNNTINNDSNPINDNSTTNNTNNNSTDSNNNDNMYD